MTPTPITHEVLLLALRDDEGTSVIESAVLDLALAGAALAEPALAGRIALVHDRVVVIDSTRASVPAVDRVVRLIESESRPRKPLHWVHELAGREIRDATIESLVSSGVLRSQPARLLGVFPVVRYPAADPTIESLLLDRIAATLRGDLVPDARIRALISLLDACGLVKPTFGRQPKAKLRALTDGDWIAKAVRHAISARTVTAVS